MQTHKDEKYKDEIMKIRSNNNNARQQDNETIQKL